MEGPCISFSLFILAPVRHLGVRTYLGTQQARKNTHSHSRTHTRTHSLPVSSNKRIIHSNSIDAHLLHSRLDDSVRIPWAIHTTLHKRWTRPNMAPRVAWYTHKDRANKSVPSRACKSTGNRSVPISVGETRGTLVLLTPYHTLQRLGRDINLSSCPLEFGAGFFCRRYLEQPKCLRTCQTLLAKHPCTRRWEAQNIKKAVASKSVSL